MRGYFGIGAIGMKNSENYGTLFRSAFSLGAKFIFLIGCRFKRQVSDTTCSHKHIPLFTYTTFEEFYQNLPYNCKLIGIEKIQEATPLHVFKHPERACYLLGPEDGSIPKYVIDKCHDLVVLNGRYCLNVAVAGSIVMHDRSRRSK